jgi:2-polyprenyl-3-methyl-5-hydroxy-6-metoxy-1,4-benzoquinol methylase
MVDVPAERVSATETSQVDVLDDTPERFDPVVMHGRLIEAEHIARYAWVASLVAGKRVLDAGCGTGYGSNILARAGADEVMAVDIDERTIVGARETVEDGVTFAVEDVRRLACADVSFDVVVCFELLEHVETPAAVLDELRRVLTPGGVLAVSSPNRGVYPPGNPHHLHEFSRAELAEALAARFEHVRVVRQHDWLASSIVEDAELDAEGGFRARARSMLSEAAGKELYSVALASDAELPPMSPHLVVTDTADLKWWQERVHVLQEEVHAAHHCAAAAGDDLQAERARSREVTNQLLATETQLAQELEKCAVAESRLADARDELKQREQQLADVEQQLADMEASRAWRLAARYWRARGRLKKLLRLGR